MYAHLLAAFLAIVLILQPHEMDVNCLLVLSLQSSDDRDSSRLTQL